MVSNDTKQLAGEIQNRIRTDGISYQPLRDLLDVAVYAFEKENDTKWALKVAGYVKQCCVYAIQNNLDVIRMDDLYWKAIKVEAPYWFESFLFYMEKNRAPEKRFYEPRKRTQHVVVMDLQDLEERKIRFYGLSEPPRVGKSTICIFYMAWHIGRHKSSHNAMSGHSGILADRFYRDVMKLTTDEEYTYSEIFPDVLLENKSADKNELFFDKREAFATLTCRGIDGTWTGAVDISSDGILYVDDLIRDRTESLSPIRLENRFQDYLNVLVDRKNDGSAELMVATLWNVADPLSRLADMYKGNPLYRFRKIPALDENDESNFQYDYGLGFSTEYYRDMRTRLDKNEWMAKFQQAPFVREGLLFPEEEIQTFNGVLPDGEYICLEACDPAFGGADNLSMPIAKIRKDDPNGLLYIIDWVFLQGDKEITAPVVVSHSIDNNVTRLQGERNNGGGLYFDFVGEKFKERDYRISITTQLANNKMSKSEKILLYSSDVKRRCVFLEENLRSSMYKKAMDEMMMYTQVGKNPHEDSVDSIVQLLQMTEAQFSMARIIASPI